MPDTEKGCPKCRAKMRMLESAAFALPPIAFKPTGEATLATGSGFPVAVWHCDKCGYVELYSADVLWKR